MVLEGSVEVSERNEDESLFASFLGLGMSVLIESKNRIKLQICGYKSGSFG